MEIWASLLLKCQVLEICKAVSVDLVNTWEMKWTKFHKWCINLKVIHILICNLKAGAPILHLTWAKIINYIKTVVLPVKKLSAETELATPLLAKMVIVKSKIPVTIKLNTHLRMLKTQLRTNQKISKRRKEKSSQLNLFQLRKNEIIQNLES